MSTALALPNAQPKAPLSAGGNVRAIVPQDFEQAYRFATMIAASGMAPKGMEKPEALMAAILQGLEVGMTPMMAVQSIAVVNGRATVWGDGAIALVRASGLCEFIQEAIEGSGDDMVATCETKRAGDPKPTVRRFSMADAKKAGLAGKSGPWTQYPARMLQMRARGFALRDAFADVLRGLAIREEVEDYAPQPPTPPTPPVPPAPPAAALAPPKTEPQVIEAQSGEPLAPAEAGVDQLLLEIEAAETHDSLSDVLAAWGDAMSGWPQADRVAGQNAYEARGAALEAIGNAALGALASNDMARVEAELDRVAAPAETTPIIWGLAKSKAGLGTKRFRLWFSSLSERDQEIIGSAPEDFAELAAEADKKAGA